MDIAAASGKLSKIDLKLQIDGMEVDVLWFRVLQTQGRWIISRHMHSSYEFHFVNAGSCRVRLDDREFIAKSGEFYLTAPAVLHEQSGEGSGDYIEYSINCDITESPQEDTEGGRMHEILDRAACLPVADTYGAMKYFRMALEEADSQSLGYYNSIKSLAALILTSATRALCDTHIKKYTVPTKTASDDYRFAQIRQYIEDNVCSRITAEDLRSHLYLGNKQICRIIKRNTGRCTKSYISSVRLKKAKSLLKETNRSIKEISDLLGFSSEYYFSEFFKREEGYPPGIFRKNVQIS